MVLTSRIILLTNVVPVTVSRGHCVQLEPTPPAGVDAAVDEEEEEEEVSGVTCSRNHPR